MTIFLLILLVLLVLFLIYWFFIRKPELDAATSLKQVHLESLENNMERYRLFWTQATATTANSQDVIAVINSGSATPIATDKLMSTSEIISDFATGASVTWWVRTYNADKSKFSDSAHASFISTNEEPLNAATGLGNSWIAHVA